MTDLLSKAMAEIERLGPEEQDAIAQLLLEQLEEREWDRLVARPESQRFLDHLAAEARREIAAGRTQASTDDW